MSLAGTDWINMEPLSGQPLYVVTNFVTNPTGRVAGTGNFLQNDLDSPVAFEYSYDPNTGTGAIDAIDYDPGTFTVSPDGTTMDITMPEYPSTFTAILLDATLSTMNGTVWNTITPRGIYSSLDFEEDSIQAVFGDGTFPEYGLLFYDGVSAGLTQAMGIFYLDYNEDNVLTVNFPNFYHYHPDPVVYTPSEEVRASLNGTVWAAKTINETVTFETSEAAFAGNVKVTVPYVYNGKQAGGAGDRPYTKSEPGSFIVQDNGPGNPQSVMFFNWLNSNETLTFYKQVQPLDAGL